MISRSRNHTSASHGSLSAMEGRLHKLIFTIGIVLLFFAGSVRTVSDTSQTFENVSAGYLFLMGHTLVGLATLAWLLRCRTWLIFFRLGYQKWVLGLIIWASVMLVSGIIRQNPLEPLALDTGLMIVFLSGIFLGSQHENWRLIGKICLWCLVLIAVPVIILGFWSAPEFTRSELTTHPVYRSQALLVPATFFLLLTRLERGWWRYLISLSCCGLYFVGQILAGKRAPVMRVLFFLLMAEIVLPWITRRLKVSKLLLLALLLAVSAMLFASTLLVNERIVELNERFSGLGDTITYTLGIGNPSQPLIFDQETFRAREVEIMFEEMSWLQLVVGTGLGGYVVSPEFDHWQLEVGGVLVPGRTEVHIGIFWALLKGGGIFWCLLYSGIFSILLSYKRFNSHPLDLSCWMFLLGIVIFHTMEGLWMTNGFEVTALIMGACIGRCVSAQQRNAVSEKVGGAQAQKWKVRHLETVPQV